MKGFVFCILISFAAAAAAQDQEQDQDQSKAVPAKLIISVNLANGNVVSFYELERGDIFVSEKGKVPNKPAFSGEELQEKGPLAIFERIKEPDTKAPDALLNWKRKTPKGDKPKDIELKREVIERDQKDRGASGHTSGGGGAMLILASLDADSALRLASSHDGACPASWFTSNLCLSPTPSGTSWCKTYRSGNSTTTYGGSFYSVGAACSYRGTIDFRMRWWYQWPVIAPRTHTQFDLTIPAGYYHFGGVATSINHKASFQIYNASGDGLHHSGCMAGIGGYCR